MLTFQEALTALKLGKDVRFSAWPTGRFIRLVGEQIRLYSPGPRGRPTIGPVYFPTTQPELLHSTWSIA